MNWLFPGFLAGGLLVGLPIVLHFLRHKTKTLVPFPSLRYLGQTAIRDTRRHRLQRLLTLLLRCLIIGLLATAFARPFWVDAMARSQRVMILALDNSMSMQTTGRWEKSKQWATEQMAELGPGDEAALLIMHPTPHWLVRKTKDLSQVRRQLQTAQPGFTETHYSSALRVAGDMLTASGAGHKTLVWMADEQRIGWLGVDLAKALPAGIDFRFLPSPDAPQKQAAITSLKWTGEKTLSANVRLYLPEQDERKMTLRVGSKVLAEQTVKLHAGDNKVDWNVTVPSDASGISMLLATDDLPADDVAWATRPQTNSNTVLLDASPQPDFLRHALLSTQKLGTGGVTLADLPVGAWPRKSVAIIRHFSKLSAEKRGNLEQFMKTGGPVWLWIDGSPELTEWLQKNGIRIAERLITEDAAHLKDWDPEHGTLAAFTGQSLLPLLEVEFYQGYNLESESLLPLANWPDGKTAQAEWSSQGRHLFLTGFPMDRAATNWPTLPSFVPFVHQTVKWLGSFQSAKGDWHVGESIPLPAGEGVWRTLDAAQPQKERPAQGGIAPESPGLYDFVAGSVHEVYAVNILSKESDLTPWPNPEQLASLGQGQEISPARTAAATHLLSNEASENQQRNWWWLLAFCSVVLMAELFLANRTAL